jgi:RsiW-degrading membrane proteinase PrsW (M82 family)
MQDPAPLDRLSLDAPEPPREPEWTRREKDGLSAALSLAVLGVGGLWIFAERIDRPWARPLIFLSVLAASLGPALAALLLVAPRRTALRARHFVAGVVAAWACIELAGAARRMGLAADSGAFRAGWAPIAEELSKALVLAAMMTATDRDNDRRAIASAGVAVGAGFAFRENVVYFATAATGEELSLAWLVLRAVPPVFAHTLFGATYGTILAQSAIHARALELPAPRFSLVALVLATLAHVGYNAIPWAVLSVAPAVTVPFAIGWALLALLGTWGISRRVRSMSHEDPSLASRVSLAVVDARSIDRVAAVLAVALLGLWAIPLAVARYLAVVFSPFALGTVVVLALATALRVDRGFVWLLLGVAARPFFSMGEAALSAIPLAYRGPAGSRLASLLGSLLWVITAAVLGARVGRARGHRTALVAGAGLAAGMVAASIGGNLAAGALLAPWRVMLGTTLALFPRTVALAAALAWISAVRPRLAPIACVLAALLAVGCDWLTARGRMLAAIPLALLFAAALAALASLARRRA